MGLISYTNGQTSVILRVKIIDSATLTGGKTGLAYNTSGLIISTIADNEASATTYTVAASNIEDITTLGTYAAPTASKCRFKAVDGTNHKGVYEIHLANARFAVSSAKSLVVSLAGASGMCDCDVVIPLTSINPYDSVRAGLTALPNASPNASGGLLTYGSSTGQLNPSSGTFSVTVSGYAGGQDPATLVLDTATSGHSTAGTVGKAIADAGSAGDPWATAIPGSYGTGTAGYIIGNRVDTTISSRLASGNVTVGGYAASQDPATYVLSTAAYKLVTDSSGRVQVQPGTSAGQVDLAAGKVKLDTTQAVPTTNTAETVGDCLNAARSQGFGKWVLSGTTLRLYASDGSTVVRTFTLDSATAPTQRV